MLPKKSFNGFLSCDGHRMPETCVSVLEVQCKSGVLRQVEQGISSFFANFLAYLMIFQSGARMPKSLQNFENHKNLLKIWQKYEEKTLVQLALNPFFGRFRVPPDPTLFL